MVYNSDIDEAMDDIKNAMHLLRQNFPDSDSIRFWEALLEVNRAFAMEDTETAMRYLTEVFAFSSRSEFPEVCTHITNAYEHVNQSCRNLEIYNLSLKQCRDSRQSLKRERIRP
jgi:hypothetical protein